MVNTKDAGQSSETPAEPSTPAILEPRNVVEALAAVMGGLPAIGKDQKADPAQGGYAYRGIEAITSHAQGLFARYKVVFVPRVLSFEVHDILVNNKPWTDTRMMVEYDIHHGPSDTKLTVGPLLGVGRDSSDKGANKCLSQTLKYALLQVLCISDRKDDPDGTTAEADAREEAPVPAWQHFGYEDEPSFELAKEMVYKARDSLSPEAREDIRQWLAGQDLNRTWPLPADVAVNMLTRAGALMAQADPDTGERQPDPQPQVKAETSNGSASVASDPVQRAVEWVKGLEMSVVRYELEIRNMSTSGEATSLRRRLAEAVAKEYAAPQEEALPF